MAKHVLYCSVMETKLAECIGVLHKLCINTFVLGNMLWNNSRNIFRIWYKTLYADYADIFLEVAQ